MKENAKKKLILLLLLVLALGMGVVFATQVVITKNGAPGMKLIEIFDDWLDYELVEMKEMIKNFDYHYISTTLSFAVLPLSMISLGFLALSLKFNRCKILSVILSVIVFLASLASIYALIMLSKDTNFVISSFAYVYFGVAILGTFITFLYAKNK